MVPFKMMNRSSIPSLSVSCHFFVRRFFVFFFVSVLLLAVTTTTYYVADAMFVDEIGIFDFTIPTTGHGPVQYVEIVNNGNIIITSDNGPSSSTGAATSTSCYVAGRDIMSGTILWKQKVCTTQLVAKNSNNNYQGHITLVSKNHKFVITYDIMNGIVRAWDVMTGIFQWEIDVLSDIPSLSASHRNRLVSFQQQPSSKNSNVLTLWNVKN